MRKSKNMRKKLASWINHWQDFMWDNVIKPIADLFEIDCMYCWFWRGVFLGSILTSISFLIIVKALQ